MNSKAPVYEILTEQKLPLANLLTKMHFEQNPGLLARYGDEGKEKCLQDAAYHLFYLAEAVKAESKELFSSYIEWAASMLQSRKVPKGVLTDNLHFMNQACGVLLPAAAHQVISGYIKNAVSRLKNINPLPETYLTNDNPLLPYAKKYLSCLLQGKREMARGVIDELVKNKQSIHDIYEYIFEATQYEVGLLWQTNKITVAHEHYCTAATQMIMSSLYPYIFNTKRKNVMMVACSITGDVHEIGIRMVSDLFELAGWDTYYMGSGMPDTDILSALKEQKANVLALSVTMPYYVNKASNLIKKIRTDKDLAKLKIIVGGYAFHVPGLWKQTGADNMAKTARHAIDIANKMITDF